MPYITFTDYPAGPQYAGRAYRNSAVNPATGKYVCEVDEVLPGETEVTPAIHAATLVAADAAYQTELAAEAVAVQPVMEPPVVTS